MKYNNVAEDIGIDTKIEIILSILPDNGRKSQCQLLWLDGRKLTYMAPNVII